MNENGNKYAMAALKDRRSRLAGEVHSLKAQADAKLRQIETLDATMRIFDPDFDPATLHDWPAVSNELAARAQAWEKAAPNHARIKVGRG